MTFIRRNLFLFFALYLLWTILAGTITVRQLLSGAFCSVLTILIYEWLLAHSGTARVEGVNPRAALRFSGIVMLEVFRSGLRHVRRIASGKSETAVCRLQLTLRDEMMVMLVANAITLTPGTVALDWERGGITVLHYGNGRPQCPLELVLMTEHLQRVLLSATAREGRHA